MRPISTESPKRCGGTPTGSCSACSPPTRLATACGDGIPRRVEVAHGDPAKASLAQEMRAIAFGPGWSTPGAQTIRDRAPRLFRDVSSEVMEWATHGERHLAVLRAKQLVVSRKEGNQVFYALRDPLLIQVLDTMRRYLQGFTPAVDRLEQRFEELVAQEKNRLGTLFNPGDYP